MKVSKNWLEKNGFKKKNDYNQFIGIDAYGYSLYHNYTHYHNGSIWIREDSGSDRFHNNYTTNYWLSLDGIIYDEYINKVGDIPSIVERLYRKEDLEINSLMKSLETRRKRLDKVKKTYKITDDNL